MTNKDDMIDRIKWTIKNSESKLTDKEKESLEIEKQTQDFLKNGGKIKKVPIEKRYDISNRIILNNETKRRNDKNAGD